MKKITLVLAFFSFFVLSATAQKSIIIDVNYVLENMDDYQKAQKQLDDLAAAWKQEIAQDHDKIKSLYNKYQAEQVLLSEDMRKQREDEIMKTEREVMDKQKTKFGPEGELFQKRQELVQPIQQRVYGVIEEYAKQRGYDIVLDTNGAIVYLNPEYDKTNEIVRRLK